MRPLSWVLSLLFPMHRARVRGAATVRQVALFVKNLSHCCDVGNRCKLPLFLEGKQGDPDVALQKARDRARLRDLLRGVLCDI